VRGIKVPHALAQQRAAILALASKHGARNVRLFGSTVRGDDSGDSDVDILVDLEAGRSLLDQVGLKQDLEELLGRRVEIVVEGGISPYIEQQILSEAASL
jgi:predicted nucleotidyltransferase